MPLHPAYKAGLAGHLPAKETDIFNPTQPSVTLFDIRTYRIRTGHLLANQLIATMICLERLHISYYQIKELQCFLIRSELLESPLAHIYSMIKSSSDKESRVSSTE